MIKLKCSDFSVKVTNQTCDYNIQIVLDKYFLDEKNTTTNYIIYSKWSKCPGCF